MTGGTGGRHLPIINGRLDRAVNPSLYPGDIMALLHHQRTSFWESAGVEVSRWGRRDREEAGIPEHGTIWVGTETGREKVCPIPCNEIPFRAVRSAVWNEQSLRWEQGELLARWPGILKLLLQQHILRPCQLLSILLEEDSWKIANLQADYTLVAMVKASTEKATQEKNAI